MNILKNNKTLTKEDIAKKLLNREFSINGDKFTPKYEDELIMLNDVFTDKNVVYVKLEPYNVVVAFRMNEEDMYYLQVAYNRLYSFDITRY